MQSRKKEDCNHITWISQYKENERTLSQYNRAWRYLIKYMANPSERKAVVDLENKEEEKFKIELDSLFDSLTEKYEKWIFTNKNENWGLHLLEFHGWLKEQPKKRGKGTLSDNSAKQITNIIRGYLRHIGIVVNLNKKQKRTIMKVESMPTKDYPLNLKVKGELLKVADPVEEYVLCAGVSFGLRVSDFVTLTRGQLEPLLNQEVPMPIGEVMTKKEGVAAYPYIDREAKPAIQNLLILMNRQGRTKPSDTMIDFTTKHPDKEVNLILKGLFEKAQIPLGEFRVRFHILRKFLTDQLASVCTEDKWKHFVGKKSDSPYVQREGREAYRKVMDFTCVNHKNLSSVSDKAIVDIKARMKDLSLELGRTSGLLEIIVNDILTPEQQLRIKKISREHFGDKYPM